MADTVTPPVRIARVTTRRMHTQTVQCPLDPEMLVAEFAEELPPDIARHVREHLVFCETCSARSQALREPYQLLSSLGGEPVPHVADLRDSVRVRVRSRRALDEVARLTARLGRGGTVLLTGLLGLAVIGVFLAVAFLFPAVAGVTSRSQNILTHVPAAAPSGILYAETNKLLPVTDSSGHTWEVAEVIAANQQDGVVIHSLPASDGTPRVAQPDQLPVVVQVIEDTVIELTAPDGDGQQAIVAFDTATGAVRYVMPLTLPTGQALPKGATGTSIAVAPDHSVAYIGLNLPNPRSDNPSVLVIDLAAGKVSGALTPGYTANAPLPPPPGSLPISAFPSTAPHVDISGMRVSTGLRGAVAVSPDGQWLFNALALAGSNHQHYILIRRFSATTGSLAQELVMPGDFPLARLLSGSSIETPQVYLVSGSPNAHCYILDASDQGPILTGDVPLGGPYASPDTGFTGTLHLTLSPAGNQLYITQDVTSTDGEISGHDVWMVDVRGMNLAVHHSVSTNIGMVLPNTSTQKGAKIFALRSGIINLTDSQLTGKLTPWLQLDNGNPVIELLATDAN
ncbi:MAG TPA: hypothetical protein VFU63_09205 [Ktedonobacterales bacterium]|nr:hypothetical protein [Ktedonobacterales bacterium]